MKKILLTLLMLTLICISLSLVSSAKALYLEQIPDELKFSNDTVTHFIVIDGEEYYLGSGNTVNNFNVDAIEAQLTALGISSSDLGTKYLTKLIIPETYNGETVTYADINNDKIFKRSIYFLNCGYLVFPSTATQINDANECCAQMRCIDFGVDSQIASIPGSFMQNAGRLKILLNMPKNLNSIGASAFRNCSSLQGDENKQLYINARTIENKAFDNALTNVEEIVFGENVQSLATESFSIGERDDSIVKYIEFKCDVTEVSFPDCNSGKYVGAFYFGTNDSQRKPYSNLVCIILSNPAQANCDGMTFKEASGQNVYFNDTNGNDDFVSTSHDFDENDANIIYSSFLEEGVLSYECVKCGKTESVSVPALFKFEGFSAPEDGEIKLTVGFTVNNQAIKNYERITGNTVKFGIVAALEKMIGTNTAPLNGDASAKDNVIKASINIDVVSYEFIINGFETDEHKVLKIMLATYVEIYDADGFLLGIEYLQNKKVENNQFVYVSYIDYLKNV
jgi:hypothetical protein